MSVSDPATDLREELRALERAYTIGHHGTGGKPLGASHHARYA